MLAKLATVSPQRHEFCTGILRPGKAHKCVFAFIFMKHTKVKTGSERVGYFLKLAAVLESAYAMAKLLG